MSLVDRLGGSVVFKLAGIGFLVLILLIPLGSVGSLISEREGQRDAARARVQGLWGGQQLVGGPALRIPVDVLEHTDKGDAWVTVVHVVLPDSLAISGKLVPSVRHVGLYDVPVYQADLTLTGAFLRRDVETFLTDGPERRVRWGDVRLVVPMTQSRFLRELRTFEFAGAKREAQPAAFAGIGAIDTPVTRADLDRDAMPFAVDLTIAGSEGLDLAPLARATTATLASSWPSPQFTGSLLPSTHRIDAKGFDGKWSALALNRSFPQTWIEGEVDNARLQSAAFGVGLHQTVDVYQRNYRAIHYAILVIALTFMSFFAWEQASGVRVHAMQYLLVGAALAVFYLLLIALSEHLEFALAYGSAAAALVALIIAYLSGVLRKWSSATVAGSALATVYALLYLILISEDYALLMGAILVFAVLAAIMLLTRRFDWSRRGTASGELS